jgi:hypothetical protein
VVNAIYRVRIAMTEARIGNSMEARVIYALHIGREGQCHGRFAGRLEDGSTGRHEA